MTMFLQNLPLFADDGGWKVSSFLDSVQKSLGSWGSIITSIIGIAMVIVGIYKVAKGLISHGKGQNNWFISIALILLGGVLAITGGWAFVGSFSEGTKNTLNDMAQGSADTGGAVQDPFEYGQNNP